MGSRILILVLAHDLEAKQHDGGGALKRSRSATAGR
jgi:hypothetical protein